MTSINVGGEEFELRPERALLWKTKKILVVADLGSSQIRVERGSNVSVFTGDYKRGPDRSCEEFEVVECNHLITEATFGLPIYHWPSTEQVALEIFKWWQHCKEEKMTALLFCYALGKAQRVLAELCRLTDEPVYLHGAVLGLTDIYRQQGIKMINTFPVLDDKGPWDGRLVIAPPSAFRSPWMKRFKSVSTGFASGWMAVRAHRRRRGYDRGFILSDHADWGELIRTVRETKAKLVDVTHGSSDTLARYLRESENIEAQPLVTHYGAEEE
jgi:putative mRNA 3-end processing factor